MLQSGVYSYDNSDLQKEIISIKDFVNRNYLHLAITLEDISSRIFRSDKTLIYYDKDSNIKGVLLLSINPSNQCLVVPLLVGTTNNTMVFAIGEIICELLNKGLQSIEFFVRKTNLSVINSCLKHHIPQVRYASATHLMFKMPASAYLYCFRKFHHKYLENIQSYNVVEFISTNNKICVNTDYRKRKDLFLWKKNHYYIKSYDTSIHGKPEILPCFFPNEGINLYGKNLETYLSDKQTASVTASIDTEYSPTTAFILPTLSCNLRCRYCYSDATPNKGLLLSYDDGKTVIDYIIQNASKSIRRNASVIFHGGGEPTLCVALIGKLVQYAIDESQKQGVNISFSASTNGTILTNELLELYSKFSSIQLSFDGLENTQNFHRPFSNNQPSFDVVVSNLRTIREFYPNMRIAIRSTVSSASVSEMAEFVEFAHKLGANKVVFEPLVVTGRALSDSDLQAPDMEDFITNYKQACSVAKRLDIRIGCSAEILYRDCNFCGASNSNLVLTPSGYISTCVEVSTLNDPLSELFIIGRCDNNNVIIDKDKLYKIRRKGRSRNIECQFCIAESACRGNCLSHSIRYSENNNIFMVNSLCMMQTNLFLHKLRKLHANME